MGWPYLAGIVKHRAPWRPARQDNRLMRSLMHMGWRRGVAALCILFMAVAGVAAPQAAAQTRQSQPRTPPQQDDDRPAPNETRPLPEIVARVQSTPPYNTMDYIGLESFQVRQRIYILRFIDGRQVVVVHVDARSGRIVGRAP
jgi:hypothetical protein